MTKGWRKQYQDEFRMAKEALKPLGGKVFWVDFDYEAFRYKAPGVQLIFYPHRTTAGHEHLRIRSNGTTDAALAIKALFLLREAAGSCCTFSAKTMPKEVA